MRCSFAIGLVLGLMATASVCTAAKQPGALFLAMDPGARAVGMAGAFCGLADDALATYYNPAGLGFLRTFDFCLDHTNWLPSLYPGMHYAFMSAAIPLGRSTTIAPACTYFTSGETIATDPYGNEIGRFRNWDLALGLNCGVSLSDVVGLGGGVKYIHSYLYPSRVREWFDMGGGTARSLALDLATLVRPSVPLGQVGLGAALQNVGPSLQYTEGGEREAVPRSMRLGASYTVGLAEVMDLIGQPISISFSQKWLSDWFGQEFFRITLTGSVYRCLVGESPRRGALEGFRKSFGLEVVPFGVLGVRCGHVFSEYGWSRWTWGAGLNLKFLGVNIGEDCRSNWWSELRLNIGTPFLP